MHKRRAILQDLKSQLVDSGQFAAVYIQRIPPRQAYPVINLYMDSETVQSSVVQWPDRLQERTLTVSIECWFRGNNIDEATETNMDRFSEAIEQIIMQPAAASEITLISTTPSVDETDPELHYMTLTYQVEYETYQNNPSA